ERRAIGAAQAPVRILGIAADAGAGSLELAEVHVAQLGRPRRAGQLVAAVQLPGGVVLVAAGDEPGGASGVAAVVGMALTDVGAHIGLGEGRTAGQGDQGDGAGNQSLLHFKSSSKSTPKSDEEILGWGFPEKAEKVGQEQHKTVNLW